MHRIDGDGNAANMFTEGDPGQAIPATVVTDDWLNALQEEICTLLEAMGVTLVKGTNTQLRDACVAAATALKLMRRDANGRAKVAAPSASDDVAILSTVTDHNAVTNPHSAASAPTASRLALRDASGRSQFADPAAAQDAATKAYVDGLTAAVIAGTWAAGWTDAGTSSVVRGHDGMVVLNLSATYGGGGTGTILTLPTGFRPGSVYGCGFDTNGGGIVAFSVGATGLVILQSVAPVSGHTYYLSVAFKV